jgi:hypothetical protein
LNGRKIVLRGRLLHTTILPYKGSSCALARLAHGIFRTQELGAHPAEDVIHDGFRIRDLLIPRPPARRSGVYIRTQIGVLLDSDRERIETQAGKTRMYL